ncbi:MAG: hypothetical protein ABIF77_04000 [bacterium]
MCARTMIYSLLLVFLLAGDVVAQVVDFFTLPRRPVATRFFVEVSCGPLGLELMRMGRSAPERVTGMRESP